MDAVELVRRGEDAPVALACSACGMIFALGQEKYAQQCCNRHCTVCGHEFAGSARGGGGYCPACLRVKEDEQETARFAKAQKVPSGTHNGPVYDPWGDKFYSDVDEYLSDLEEAESPVPYLWTCTAFHPCADADSIVENMLADHHEDAYVTAYAELKAFLDTWNAKQTDVSWDPNYDVAVTFV